MEYRQNKCKRHKWHPKKQVSSRMDSGKVFKSGEKGREFRKKSVIVRIVIPKLIYAAGFIEIGKRDSVQNQGEMFGENGGGMKWTLKNMQMSQIPSQNQSTHHILSESDYIWESV